MKNQKRLGVAAIALTGLLASCSSAGEGQATSSTTSIAKSCINPTEITKQTIVSDQEIQFELRNGEIWVNKFPRACSGLKLAGGFSWEVRSSLVCSNQERITVLETGTPCQIGEFTRTAAR